MQKKKKRVIVALAVIVAFMAVGYALLSQELTINGNSKITANWDVKITGITATSQGGINMNNGFTAEAEPSFTDTTATFNAALPQPGSGIVYTVTVSNNGSMDAKLKSITGLDAVNAQEPSDVQYAINGANTDDVLGSGESKTIQVVVAWNGDATSIPTTVEKTATLTFNYEQVASGTGSN